MIQAPSPLHTIETQRLNIAYYRCGPQTQNGKTVILLHGWPDDALTYNKILPALHEAGWETIIPYLRGCGPTRFTSGEVYRSGQLSALGQDLLDFASALGLDQFAVIGHDWGARAAYIASCLAPERISHCVAISVGWGTNTPDQTLSLEQVQNYWYQWYMSMDRGAELVNNQWPEYTHHIWRVWNPRWDFSQQEFEATAASFNNPDWCDITLHSYRVRWGLAPKDPDYEALEIRLQANAIIAVPTLVIHGGGDPCNAPASSAAKEALFSGSYQRVVIDGVGHFPQREAPEQVSQAILSFL